MGQLNHIDPAMVPRPTGAGRQDMEAVYRYLFGLAENLRYRLEDSERRLRALEGKGKKGKE